MTTKVSIRRSKTKPEVLFTPLIDCVFNLLIFFAVSTTLIISPASIKVKLPKAVTAETQKRDIIINITKDGLIIYNGELKSLEEMKEIVINELKVNPHVLVAINADKEVVYNRVIEVMDTLRDVGATNIALATEKKIKREETKF